MIFPPESALEARRKLLEQAGAGEMTLDTAFERALELDPDDALSLQMLALHRKSQGDLPGAEGYFWRAVKAQPCDNVPYFGIGACVKDRGAAALSAALLELGLRKVLLYDETLEEYRRSVSGMNKKYSSGLPESTDRATLESFADRLASFKRDEPESVAEQMRPYRLLHELQAAGNATDNGLVDRILERRAECAPLLVGALRGWACDRLPSDAAPVVRAGLGLLGEIGDPEFLPALLEFCTAAHHELRHAANWAVCRIAQQRPRDALAVFRAIKANLEPAERAALIDHLGFMPETEGRMEALLSFLDDLGSLPKDERHEVCMLAATALLGTGGPSARQALLTRLRRHSAAWPRKTAAELQDLLDLRPEEWPEIDPPIWAGGTVYEICRGEFPAEPDDEDGFEPEPPTVQRPPAPGRNSPCWCGSGRKYKKCHLEADERAAREGRPAGVDPDSGDATALAADLRTRVLEFANGQLREHEIREAIRLFAGPELEDLDDATKIAFFDWLIHDHTVKRFGRTVMLEYLERNRARLSDRERRMLEALAGSRYGLYEVQEVERGVGLRLKDLLTGEQFFAHDVNSSNRSARWDCLLFRVQDLEGTKRLSGTGLEVPRSQCERLRAWIAADRDRTGLPWPEYLRANSPRLRQQAFRMGKEALASLRLVSAEGDPIVLSKAVYRILDEKALLRALEASTVLERLDPAGDSGGIDFTWLEHPRRGDERRRVLGSLHLDADRLRLECQTRSRLERGKQLLARLAPGLLEFRLERFTSPDKLKREAAKGPRSESEIPPEVQREVIQEYLNQHYREWPDVPLPALGGRTPREAAQTDEGRAQVAELLKFIENGEERKRLRGEAWFDVSSLRSELNIGL